MALSQQEKNVRLEAETWQDKMKAGLNQGLALVQEHAQKGYEATKERVSTARAGQELLEKGGQAAESCIRAKMLAKVAIGQSEDIYARVKQAKENLEETVLYLRSAHQSAENMPEGCGGVSSFHELAEAYEAKATLYKMLLESLSDDEELPKPPAMSPAEEDAALLLQFKDGYKQTSRRVAEGAELIRKNTVETGNILTSQCMGASVCV
mmetsp:Transcript_59861/g.73337  ORF Transcript_59861/g.73337 Transcript_59861/m.73337 type:complete len:209 (-) Transcript_59861:274-900(-)